MPQGQWAKRFRWRQRQGPYTRRRPEDTVLYHLVQEHLETFLAQVELETGSGLPDFVKDEFDAFSNAGSSPTVFYACVAMTVAMRSSSPFRVRSVASARAVAPGAWPRPPPT